MALADKTPAPFRMPPGIKLVRVNLRTGLRAAADDPTSIMEAFKPGEEPDDAYSVIGFTGTPEDRRAAAGRRSPIGEQQQPRRLTFGARARLACGETRGLTRAPPRLQPRYRPLYRCHHIPQHRGHPMRAEPQKHVDSIKESLVLLRRHL